MAAVTLLVFGACEKDLDLEIREQGGQLVLFSFITPDSVFKVHVSKSVSNLSLNDFDRVYNSTVNIYQNETLVDSFLFPFDQLWASRPEVKPQEGDVFKIVVNDGEGLTATGQTTVPQAIPIARLDTATITSLSADGTYQQTFKCTLVIPDPEDEANYYQLFMLEKSCSLIDGNTICVKQMVDFAKEDDVFYFRDQEGSLLGGIDFGGCFSDFLFQGTQYSLDVQIPLQYKSNPPAGTQRTLYFLLISQTSDYYNYFRSRVVAEYSYDLPIIDPIKIFSNIEGGLGLVGGLSVAVDSLVFSHVSE
jgi:hypothetical protein